MAGDQHVSNELGPEIVPVFVVDHDRPEYEFLEGTRRCSAIVIATAAAALRSTARLACGLGSNNLVIVDRVIVLCAATSMFLKFNPATTGETAVTTARAIDRRWGAQRPFAAVASNNTLTEAGTGGENFAQMLLTGSNGTLNGFEWRDPIVINPSSSLIVVPGTDNLQLTATFVWRERIQGKYERA